MGWTCRPGWRPGSGTFVPAPVSAPITSVGANEYRGQVTANGETRKETMAAISRAPSGPLGALRRALGVRAQGRTGRPAIVMPLRGGSAALIGRSDCRRLITTVTEEDIENPAPGIAGWLEKRQARRSALLVVPDRAAGVAIALRWGISPERFRLASSFEGAGGGELLATAARRPWHSRA